MFGEEAVVGDVALEGVDDIVAVAPGVAGGDAAADFDVIGVVSLIEPVAGPAFAEGLGGEEAVDDLVGRRVAGEVVLFGEGGG